VRRTDRVGLYLLGVMKTSFLCWCGVFFGGLEVGGGGGVVGGVPPALVGRRHDRFNA